MKLRTRNDALTLADQLAAAMVEDQSLDASQTREINEIKTSFKPHRDKVKKVIKSLKTRLAIWIGNHAPELFEGADTGTVSTNLIEIQRRRNPPAVEPIDPDTDEETLVNLVLQAGLDTVLEYRTLISKERLADLTDEELLSIGWRRRRGHTITYRPLANRTRTTTVKAS